MEGASPHPCGGLFAGKFLNKNMKNKILLVLLCLVIGGFIGYALKSYQDFRSNAQATKAIDSAFGFLSASSSNQ
jgi:hypothetical protein